MIKFKLHTAILAMIVFFVMATNAFAATVTLNLNVTLDRVQRVPTVAVFCGVYDHLSTTPPNLIQSATRSIAPNANGVVNRNFSIPIEIGNAPARTFECRLRPVAWDTNGEVPSERHSEFFDMSNTTLFVRGVFIKNSAGEITGFEPLR